MWPQPDPENAIPINIFVILNCIKFGLWSLRVSGARTGEMINRAMIIFAFVTTTSSLLPPHPVLLHTPYNVYIYIHAGPGGWSSLFAVNGVENKLE